MQKNDKVYTFLLSRSSKSNIYIKRFAVSKRIVHFGSVGIFLILGLTTLGFGVSGVIRNTVFAKTISETAVLTQIAAAPRQAAETIDYSRPAPSDAYAVNSGGPAATDPASTEDAAFDNQLKSTLASLDPAFVPSIWPHSGKINNEFGFRRNPFGGRSYEFHPGMDIDGERGEIVIAPAGGIVIKAGWTGGYGNMVEIDHGKGLTTRYGHLSKIDAAVGDNVTRGQLIGYVGSTGRSTGPHLHYELRFNDKSINPRHVLPPEATELIAK